MEGANNICVTPKRSPSRGVLRERQVEARRSLFERTDSDLSDISPLSRTSSEILSPEKKSPFKVVTPFRLKGVALLSPDRGIKPNLFYGVSKSACARLDGAAMYREIRESLPSSNCKARTCLFLDDLPRNKKRSRSSGDPNKSIRQERKKIKLQPSLSHGIRKPSKTELRKREILKKKKAMRKIKEKKLEEKKKMLKKGKRKYNWEIFNTSEDLQKSTWRSSVVLLTPPQSTKKKRLMGNSSDYLSPLKLDEVDKDKNNEDKENQEGSTTNDDLVKEIREGVLDMMKEDDDDELKLEVTELLDRLNGGDETEIVVNDLKKNELDNDGPADNAESNKPASTPTNQKYFSVFNIGHKNSSPAASLPIESSSHKKKLGLGLNQLQLDVGQNNLREIECSGCGIVYVQGNPEDMAEHEIFHFKFKELHFNGWKNERVVRFDGSSKIICVRNSDCKQWWKKATSVLDVIDSELGYPSHGPPTTQIYLYVTGKFIRGVIAVSPLTRAYKMLPIEGSDDVGLCSEEEYPVKCLISRMWVDPKFRRCNVASTILDSVRSNFIFGYILKCSDMAFSSPTDDGRKFIETYTKTKEYFIYS